MGESENYFFFGTYCSLRSQSCLKHSAKWVNEVECVSKVKVILWPWWKVTQISKLNVWLLVCILRWAIQGLLALLFINKLEIFRDRVSILGPVVQSIVSLTNGLRSQLVKCVLWLYYQIHWYFLLKKWEKLLRFSHFFNKKFWHIFDINGWNFN